MATLTYKRLRDAVSGKAAAFRAKVELQPIDGPGGKVFPPTYADATFVTEERMIGGEAVPCILLDSVPSQANRMEQALLDGIERGEIELPLIQVDFGDQATDRRILVTALDAPHRMADALFRDSLLDATPFRKSDVGKCLDTASQTNATDVFGYCPTALLFGMWDSTRLHGGIGPKFTRAMVSEIVAINACTGKKVASRLDPVPISASQVLYKAKEGADCAWTLDPKLAQKKKSTAVPIKGKGRPSEVVLGNIAPSIEDGGITMDSAAQSITLSLAALRNLGFPLNVSEPADAKVNDAARTVLAAIGLCAAALANESGYFLRSRCHLWPSGPVQWELLDSPGKTPETFDLPAEAATKVLKDAVGAACKAGLPWSGSIELTPSESLVQLVNASHDLIGQEGG